MNRSLATKYTISLLCLGLALTLTACGANNARQGSVQEVATITSVPLTETPALQVTSTAVATIVLIEDSQELHEARKYTEQGNFDMAVNLLNRVYAVYRDEPVVQKQFAHTYLTWGKQLLDESKGEPSKIVTALDKFTSGLAVAPSGGSEREALQREVELAQLYITASKQWEQLQKLQSDEADLQEQLSLADQLLVGLDKLRELRSDYPGLKAIYSDGMATIGQIYMAESAKSDNRVALLQQAEQVCGRALELNPSHSAASECQQQAKPTPTPQATPTRPPEPTPRPIRLVVVKINSDDSPGCISIGVRNHSAAGWSLTIDGLRMGATFGGGNARICGLPDHDFTFTIRNAAGNPIQGGSGIPARGRDIFIATAQ